MAGVSVRYSRCWEMQWDGSLFDDCTGANCRSQNSHNERMSGQFLFQEFTYTVLPDPPLMTTTGPRQASYTVDSKILGLESTNRATNKEALPILENK